jgi:enediyne biosynthesis protein CalE5
MTTTSQGAPGRVADDRPGPAAMWGAVAPAWERSVQFVDHRAGEVTAWMLDAAELAPGQSVLDVGCGPGGAGIAAAARVGPTGTVVLSDVAPEMVEVAAERAAAAGLTWARGEVMDANELAHEPAERYDAVLSRDGIQFASDPVQAFAGLHHVLKPGGRVALAVWGTPAQNPWLGLVMQAASEVLGRPFPPPGQPGPFSLADQNELAGLLAGAGFGQVRIEEMAAPMRPPSPEEWVERASSLSGPLAAVLRTVPDEVARRAKARAVELARPYVTDEGLVLPGVAVLAAARRTD